MTLKQNKYNLFWLFCHAVQDVYNVIKSSKFAESLLLKKEKRQGLCLT